MGVEEIRSDAFEVMRTTAMDHAVWAGAVGSTAAAIFANKMRYDMLPTIGLVLAGHFGGHAVYTEMSKSKTPIGGVVHQPYIPGALYYK